MAKESCWEFLVAFAAVKSILMEISFMSFACQPFLKVQVKTWQSNRSQQIGLALPNSMTPVLKTSVVPGTFRLHSLGSILATDPNSTLGTKISTLVSVLVGLGPSLTTVYVWKKLAVSRSYSNSLSLASNLAITTSGSYFKSWLRTKIKYLTLKMVVFPKSYVIFPSP